jgi:hypothetical protein
MDLDPLDRLTFDEVVIRDGSYERRMSAQDFVECPVEYSVPAVSSGRAVLVHGERELPPAIGVQVLNRTLAAIKRAHARNV